ncbi:hypothetical protein KCP77_21985 [Salmonella enterica subsp. enterica]|nr:hypothetical protein KCP77_21985 [Salmonella enterica subsp. enterica]
MKHRAEDGFTDTNTTWTTCFDAFLKLADKGQCSTRELEALAFVNINSKKGSEQVWCWRYGGSSDIATAS